MPSGQVQLILGCVREGRRERPSGTQSGSPENLDSESGRPRTFFEPPRAPWLLARIGGARGTGKQIGENRQGVIRVGAGDAPPHVLPDELRGAERHVSAAGGARYARGGGRGLVVVAGRGSALLTTPGAARQRSARGNRQCQHDREDRCSEHVILASKRSKNDARRYATGSSEITSTLAVARRCRAALCRIFPSGCQKSRAFSRYQRGSRRGPRPPPPPGRPPPPPPAGLGRAALTASVRPSSSVSFRR